MKIYGMLLIFCSFSCIQSTLHNDEVCVRFTSQEKQFDNEHYSNSRWNERINRLNKNHLQEIHNNQNTLANYDYGSAYTKLLLAELTWPKRFSMQSWLPPGFQDNFEKHGWWDRHFTSDIPKRNYEIVFYNRLIANCGYRYTPEQLVQHQCAQMRRWADYFYDGFHSFIREFPCYEDYMLELDAELKSNQRLRHKVKKIEPRAYDAIAKEGARIRKKREHEQRKKEQQRIHKGRLLQKHYKHERELFAQESFNKQRDELVLCALDWESENPERAAALKEALEDSKAVARNYSLSESAQCTLQEIGCDASIYTTCYGNALQQELHKEIIAELETACTLPKFAHEFEQNIQQSAVSFLDGACKTNEMGDCVGASKLIDCAKVFLDYSAAAIEGISEGLVEGCIDAVTGVYHMFRHPAKTVQALGKVAVKLSELIHDYVPYYKPLCFAANEEQKVDALRNHERVHQNWRNAEKQLIHWWRSTPSRNKIHQITKGITNAATNVIVGNACLDLVGKLGKLAHAEAFAFCRRSEKVLAVGIELEMPMMLNALPEAEQVVQAPASKLLGAVEEILVPPKPGLWQATPQAVEEAMKYAMKESKFRHIFKKTEHNLEPLVLKLQNEENVIRAILNSAQDLLPAEGVFSGIAVPVEGFIVYVRGRVMDGIPKLGTFFIK